MGNRKESNEAGRSSRAGRGASRETAVPAEALVSPRREQHTRKGQAQSPRELTHNEPPRRKRKGGLGER
jgi:hypothetical protein